MRKSRWDQGPADNNNDSKSNSRWDQVDGSSSSSTNSKSSLPSTKPPSRWDDEAPPKNQQKSSLSRWDETPSSSNETDTEDTPMQDHESKSNIDEWDRLEGENLEKDKNEDMDDVPKSKKSSRWDETPMELSNNKKAFNKWDQTPLDSESSQIKKTGLSKWDETPVNTEGEKKPVGMDLQLTGFTPLQREIDERNVPLSDEEIDALLPKGYKIIEPPKNYSRKIPDTPSLNDQLIQQSPGYYQIPDANKPKDAYGIASAGFSGTDDDPLGLGVPLVKQDDIKIFGKLIQQQQKQKEMIQEAISKNEGEVEPEKLPNIEDTMTNAEKIERRIMILLLKIKNGSPQIRKQALRLLTSKAREFGAGPLFEQILPCLMSKTIEDQERHLLVKVIDRIIFKLDELVRPYVQNVLIVIEPMLIDEDFYARVEAREIISNLAKAAGLPTMIARMRPDIDNKDEIVRNTTARAFAVVASALGIPNLIPFLRAVVKSKVWEARHTGLKIIQQIAILVGCSVLPHLKQLVGIVGPTLNDTEPKVVRVAALAISALAEASAPYGIEAFDSVLKPLWLGIHKHKKRTLASFLKAIGFLIPLMDPEHAAYYTKMVVEILKREFGSSDTEMQKIVMTVVKQCITTEGVTKNFILDSILDDFLRYFWVKRMALDKNQYRTVVETMGAFAKKVGCSAIISRIVVNLKDDSESFRKMTMDTIKCIIEDLTINNTVSDLDKELERLLVENALYAVKQTSELFSNLFLSSEASTGAGTGTGGGSSQNPLFNPLFESKGYKGIGGAVSIVVLRGFGIIANHLGVRCKPYLVQIVQLIQDFLIHKSPKVRQYGADLLVESTSVLKVCADHTRSLIENSSGTKAKSGPKRGISSTLGISEGILGSSGSENEVSEPSIVNAEEKILVHLGQVLYEYLGEEFPEVLGSIMRAMKALLNVVGMENFKPPIRDVLPRLTPILRNRHEKVQEHCIDLVGRIADKGADFAPVHEWVRICFQLLELLKANRKKIRRSAINTFGYIAKAIGPTEVLGTLFNNLRVQDRTMRVCTTIAIAIVAETCGPFAVIPALMNEYRVPELNVQTGVLKSFSFLFEYIGVKAKDYIYSVVPLLEDALIDRDLIHRQTACTVVKHLCMGVFGCGCDDAILHLLNHIWPNIFEKQQHVQKAVIESIEGLRVGLGAGTIMMFLLAGLFHPARKVRNVYWKLYNLIYISGEDSLIPFYPRLDGKTKEEFKQLTEKLNSFKVLGKDEEDEEVTEREKKTIKEYHNKKRNNPFARDELDLVL